VKRRIPVIHGNIYDGFSELDRPLDKVRTHCVIPIQGSKGIKTSGLYLKNELTMQYRQFGMRLKVVSSWLIIKVNVDIPPWIHCIQIDG